ncbi:hypothetical protein [Streptomyces coffeae]|uniref:hypothetical protein n=1 Tax=Streptomyces coffeae TaxID=621382 RepID=UPI0027DB6646|nr:hypothetical protein [Streptomyces coffeae]
MSCRVSFKQHPGRAAKDRPCPHCARPLVCAGHDFAPPRKHDVRGWSVVAEVLGEGLRYEGLSACGCGKEPKPRPRTRPELRRYRALAARSGLSLSALLHQ